MKLSILIATQGRRNGKFVALVESILTQFTTTNEIEIVAYWNNGEVSIGEIRDALIQEAQGEYVCFVDDDDGVPDYYCAEILANLGKDYVGFEVELFEKDRLMPRVFHSIRYGVWHQDDQGYYRGITHLNPIRREIAIQGYFGRQGLGEDEEWARTVSPLARTENYISKIMYYYRHDADDTSFGGSHRAKGAYARPEIEHPNFRYHPKSKRRTRV